MVAGATIFVVLVKQETIKQVGEGIFLLAKKEIYVKRMYKK